MTEVQRASAVVDTTYCDGEAAWNDEEATEEANEDKEQPKVL